MFEDCLRESFILMGILSGIPLVACAAVGLGVSLLQAVTQIQEQTLQYAVKFGVISICIALLGSFASRELIEFFQRMFSAVAFLGKL